ncbi:hypothetical protein JRQ81_000450 [Phrynocephalus forsythii]|uniref:Uncharacterized protein n=1 Tax=Phrynocephalus forsythii TaxID=171643 RepID=A0A9Q0Y5D0_9SAUR|nr:hypothetical protein JRQ81_000450 [Phrynocephalus forsythii]
MPPIAAPLYDTRAPTCQQDCQQKQQQQQPSRQTFSIALRIAAMPWQEDASIVEEIVNLGDSLGLDVSNADVEELLEGHRTELTTEELQSIMNEQKRAAAEENVSEEEEEQEQDESRPSISTALIKETLAKWDAVQTVFETYHPDRDAIKHVTSTVNNIALPHFRKLLRHRLKQVSIDSFFVRKRTSDTE